MHGRAPTGAKLIYAVHALVIRAKNLTPTFSCAPMRILRAAVCTVGYEHGNRHLLIQFSFWKGWVLGLKHPRRKCFGALLASLVLRKGLRALSSLVWVTSDGAPFKVSGHPKCRFHRNVRAKLNVWRARGKGAGAASTKLGACLQRFCCRSGAKMAGAIHWDDLTSSVSSATRHVNMLASAHP